MSQELPTHGGSLRIYGCHAADARETAGAVTALIAREEKSGLRDLATYRAFQKRAEAIKEGLVKFLRAQKEAGHAVAGYGAAAKGNTLLNYAHVTPDLLPFICDAAPSKQNKFMPGSHIPILPPAELAERKPDIILILPWNIAPEVVKQEADVRKWGGRFVVAVPEMKEVS